MSGPAITRAGAEHSIVLAALHATSFSKPWSDDEIAKLMSQPGVFAWIIESPDPCGFIMVRAAADEAEILTLAVAPEHRRRRLASQLLHHAREELQSGATRKFFLEVSVDNTAADNLYRGFGFTEQGRRRGYYNEEGKRAVDAVVMALEI